MTEARIIRERVTSCAGCLWVSLPDDYQEFRCEHEDGPVGDIPDDLINTIHPDCPLEKEKREDE